MILNTRFATRCSAALAALLIAGFVPAGFAQSPSVELAAPTSGVNEVVGLSSVPVPVLGATAWLSVDANSGQIIAAKDLNQQVEPASLTKLMTAYLVFDAIEQGRLTLDQEVLVSENAWRTEGSRMFINPNTYVTVHELLQGVIVQSGNDATVALAEAIAGSENAFAALMNEEAARQGLTGTHFVNASGLPDPTHLTTVRDLGVLAQNLVTRFPQHLSYYSQKEYEYNDIKQPNRNRLLWLDATVDGLKTGHTSSAGYCFVSTAVRDGRRIISVLVGAPSEAARVENSLKLLNWSFQNFETVELYGADEPVVTARVWEGEAETVDLGTTKAVSVTVPRGKAAELKPVAEYTQPLIAPVESGAVVGNVSLMLDGVVLRQDSLVALQNVPQAGFFGRMMDKVRMWFE